MTLALWARYRHAPALLDVEVTNPTDLGYTGIRLVVHVPGSVKAFPEEWEDLVDGERPRFPSPPNPLGTPVVTHAVLASLRGSYSLPRFTPPNYSRMIRPAPGYTVRESGSVDIEYREFELRPGQVIVLDPVPLMVSEDPGATLTATWYATAADIRGRLTGEFPLTVTESTLDLTNLDSDDTSE